MWAIINRPYIFIDPNELGIYAAGKRTVSWSSSPNIFGTSQSNPIITLPGVTCNSGAYAHDITYPLTLPNDWGVYRDSSTPYPSTSGTNACWFVTPPSGTTAGIYKLKSSYNSNTTYYYIQVGTSNTLVWDADTATHISADTLCSPPGRRYVHCAHLLSITFFTRL